jgi:hypothetical protein
MTTSSSAPALLGFALLLNGCYTTKNVVVVPPLDTRYPVSASGQFVDANGAIVTEQQYSVKNSFSFERTVAGPRHDSRLAELRLESDLDRFVAANRGDAVTNLRIRASEYDAGSHETSARLQLAGWGLGLTGGALVAVGASLDNEGLGTAFLASGGVMAGLGILSFVFGVAADEPAKWHLQVSGDVVQAKASVDVPPTETQPAPGAAPSTDAPSAPAESPGPGFRREL